MNWHSLKIENVLISLKSNSSNGLRTSDVIGIQNQLGKNTFGKEKNFQFLVVFFSQFKNPLVYLLLFAAVLALFLKEFEDSVVILSVVIFNSFLGFFQEFRADKSLKELNRMIKMKIRVLRDEKEDLIPSEDLVPGDIIFLSAGDIVPADSRVIECFGAKANEALLSGESAPVEKSSLPVSEGSILSERSSMIFSGTVIVSGRIKAIVVAIGLKTEMGKIASLTKTLKDPLTPLEFKIKKFSFFLLIFSLFVFLLIIFVGFVKNIPSTELLLVAISQVVSLVPEGLPVAMTIASAVGVRRMSSKKAIIRKLSAVETLGSTSFICSDKTGTLTKNKMSVLEVVGPQLLENLDLEIFKMGVLCNDGVLNGDQEIGDPTETAILRKALELGLDKRSLDLLYPRTSEIPFSSENKYMMTEHTDGEGNFFIALKGAVHVVLDFCFLDDLTKKKILETTEQMSSRGLRVLGFAQLKNATLKNDPNSLKGKFHFLGLMGQMDPPRDGVRKAILECKKSGIDLMMITGDHKQTAVAIGKMVGLYEEGDIAIDGEELQRTSLDFSRVKIISRVKPEQKLEIVEKLQALGKVVAMTGDGVNDAPALARADVGIAMGITGTEVSKQASKIVLADDHFSSIIEAIKEGKLVYKNVKKIILLLFSTSLSELIILVLSLLLGFPAPFLAVQILWNNLVTEGVITVNLIMDPLEGNEMDERPIQKEASLISPLMWKRMLLIVPVIVFCTLGWFIFRMNSGVSLNLARTEAMTLLVLCEWFNVLNCRSEIKSAFSRDMFKNKWLLGGLLIGNLLQVLVIFWRPLGQYFYTTPIDLNIIPVLALVASFVLIVEEIRKLTAKRLHFFT